GDIPFSGTSRIERRYRNLRSTVLFCMASRLARVVAERGSVSIAIEPTICLNVMVSCAMSRSSSTFRRGCLRIWRYILSNSNVGDLLGQSLSFSIDESVILSPGTKSGLYREAQTEGVSSGDTNSAVA